ncbi:MAG TPA: hypothetical protein VIL16_00940 [Trebonia sp.]
MSAAPQDAPAAASRVLLVIAGTAVSHAAIARTAELAAGSVVTVIGVGSEHTAGAGSPNRSSRTVPADSQTRPVSGRVVYPGAPAERARSRQPTQAGMTGPAPPSGRPPAALRAAERPAADGTEPEQVRRVVALAMSVLDDAGVTALGRIALTDSPARAVARAARARGARVVVLDEAGSLAGAGGGAADSGLAAELRRRMYGSGIVVVAPNDHGGRWVVPS